MAPSVVISIAAMAASQSVQSRRHEIAVTVAVGAVAAAVLLQHAVGAAVVHLAQAGLAAVLIANWLGPGASKRGRSLAGVSVLAAVLALLVRPDLVIATNPYTKEDLARLSRLAVPLLSLPPQAGLVFVVGDAHVLVAEMQIRSAKPIAVDLVPGRGELSVRTDANEFRFFIRARDRDGAVQAATELSTQGPLSLVVDQTVAPGLERHLEGRSSIGVIRL
jgi:hypothetical protein